MITLIEGMPRAGKTYFAVSDILKKYYTFDEESLTWKKKDESVEVFSNVDGFMVSRDLVCEIQKAGGVNKFFTNAYQKIFAREKRHIYVIDEAQMIFNRKFIDFDVFGFFQYHGHFAINIYLITQDVGCLARELQSINEHHIKAVRRSYAYGNEFRYNYMVGNEIFRRKTLRRDLRVFSAFRSTVDVEGQKGNPFSRKYYIYIGFFVFVAVFGFYFMLKYRFGSPAVDTVAQSEVVASSSGQYKIVGMCGDRVLVRCLANRKMEKVFSDSIDGEMKVGSIVNVKKS